MSTSYIIGNCLYLPYTDHFHSGGAFTRYIECTMSGDVLSFNQYTLEEVKARGAKPIDRKNMIKALGSLPEYK